MLPVATNLVWDKIGESAGFALSRDQLLTIHSRMLSCCWAIALENSGNRSWISRSASVKSWMPMCSGSLSPPADGFKSLICSPKALISMDDAKRGKVLSNWSSLSHVSKYKISFPPEPQILHTLLPIVAFNGRMQLWHDHSMFESIANLGRCYSTSTHDWFLGS